jgi:hypothetical protein
MFYRLTNCVFVIVYGILINIIIFGDEDRKYFNIFAITAKKKLACSLFKKK